MNLNPTRELLILAALALPFAARAQERPPDWTLSGGGGYTAVTGKDGANLGGGWNVQTSIGLCLANSTSKQTAVKASTTWQASVSAVRLFWTFDYLFDRSPIEPGAVIAAQRANPANVALQNAVPTANHAAFNVVSTGPQVRYRFSRYAEFYGFGGFGWFHREVSLLGLSTQGTLLEPGNPAVFLRSASSGSIDGGAGINFKHGRRPMPYFEVRVVHGLAINSATTLIPIAAGIRF